jgi:hypothetical protein
MTVTMTTAIECLRIHVENNTPTALWGPPGCGKSEAVHQCGASLGMPVIDWRANLRDPVDARGLPVPDMKAGTTRWLRPSELPINGQHGPKGILMLDEINTASPSMQNVCLQLVLERRVGEHKLDDGWIPVATGNRASDRAIVTRLSSALKNRFAHLEIEPDINAWVAHAIESGINQYLIAFLRFRKELLHMMPKDDTVFAFPTPRQWFAVNKYLGHPSATRRALIESMVGYEPSVELEGFLRVCHELPSLQDVVTMPDTAKVPTQPAAKYAVAAMIAKGATRKTFTNILKYAERVGREFEMFTAIDATRWTPALKETDCYGSWAVKNQTLLV